MEIKDKTKKTIAGTGIAILLAISGMTGEYYINPDVDLLGEKYTGHEYKQIKEQIGEKGSQDNLNYEEIKLFVAVLNKEKDKCGGKMYPISDKQSIRDQVKKFDENGCP